MARKINSTKLPRQTNGVLHPANRRSAPPVTALYLMQLRAQAMKIAPLPRGTRLTIQVDTDAEAAQPIKIKKVE
jgi:hypothetical protein